MCIRDSGYTDNEAVGLVQEYLRQNKAAAPQKKATFAELTTNKVPPRPTGFLANPAEWDRKYGKTHNSDGTPK